MSLRLRLTLWYTAILAATLLLVSVGVYGTLSLTLSRQVNDFLDARAQQYYRALAVSGGPGRGAAAALREGLANFNPDTYAMLIQPDGTPLSATPNLPPGWMVDAGLFQTVLHSGHPAQDTVRLADSSVRLSDYAIAPKEGGPPLGVLQLGRDYTQADESLAFLRRLLALADIGSILVAFGAGWFLARQALKPIARIAQTASDIGDSRDFGRRVDYRGPRDELGRLAAAFNGMLGHIQAAYQQLEHALAAQRRFVADASHELRTPLTTIRGNLGLLSGERQMSLLNRQEALSDMVSEAERMSRLVSNLLVLARADAGLHIQKEPVHLEDIILEVYRHARLLNEHVTVLVRGPEPAEVQGSPDYLKQLLLILVDNALKNTPHGGHVEIADPVENGWVRLMVKDTGKGIPPEALPQIFDRFYQADKARSSGGTGLGLAIARWIAEEHGGHIEAASEVGAGSTFTVWLPCKPDEVEAPRPEAAVASAALG